MSFPEDEDLFQNTRMSLGDHLEELRSRLWRALIGLVVGMVAGFFISQPILEFITAPINQELRAFYAKRRQGLEDRWKKGDALLQKVDEPREITLDVRNTDLGPLQAGEEEGWRTIRARIRPVAWELALTAAREEALAQHGLMGLTLTEPFMVYFKVSLYCGAVLASPWIFFQLWSFVAAGLYPQEKRLVHVYLPISIGLFLAGVALCEFVALPLGISYLLSFYDWLHIAPDIRLGDWLSFALLMPLVFGISFQTPLLMLALAQIGITDADFYRRHRRMAIFVLSLIAAVFAISPDAINMLSLAIPLWALYELGIWLCVLAPRPVEEEVLEEESLNGEEVELWF
jgi:sec-independent protein translocase protein TatC